MRSFKKSFKLYCDRFNLKEFQNGAQWMVKASLTVMQYKICITIWNSACRGKDKNVVIATRLAFSLLQQSFVAD